MGEFKDNHVSPMTSADYKRVGMPETAEITHKKETSTLRRKFMGVALALGALTGLIGIPKMFNSDGTPTNQINNPANINLSEVDQPRNLDDKSGDIDKIRTQLELKQP